MLLNPRRSSFGRYAEEEKLLHSLHSEMVSESSKSEDEENEYNRRRSFFDSRSRDWRILPKKRKSENKIHNHDPPPKRFERGFAKIEVIDTGLINNVLT
jgi:hypothetical protein